MLHLALMALLVADEPGIDALRPAWQFKRRVTTSGADALASLALPPDLSTKAATGGRDLRLVDFQGREIPYLLDWTSQREGLATWRASLKDVRREKESAAGSSPVRSTWTIDLGDLRTFTELALDVPEVAFSWHVRVETSKDGKDYELTQSDAPLFDQTWNGERVRKTEVRFDAPVAARYVRVTARSASESSTIELQGASVTLRHRIKGDQWSKNAAAARVEVASRGATTRYRLDASSLLPFDEIEIVCADESFSRRVRLSEEVVAAGRKSERLLGDGSVFRLRGRNAQGEGESTRLRVRNGSGGDLLLDIDNGSSEALRDLKVRLHGSRVRLVFPLGVSTRELWLYYGNRATRAPAYDIESLRPRLIQALGATVATLGEELNNPRFKPEPPLRFAAVLGAPLQASQWRRERLLVPIPEEDVYALNLTAGDLGALRADLADLRVVSENDLQVPFLIDRDFALERLAFKVVREAGALPHQSRYQLTPALAGEGGDAPRVFRIEIEIADAFFERPARLLHAGQKARENEFSSITLVRRPPSSAPQVLDLDAPLGPLSLEIDDGDNAALDVHSAAGFVRVPRIVFKSPPGNLRLLLGNRAAEPPRYDLASLRSELLAYSAVTATAGVPRENKGSRETLVSRLRGAPQSAIVWGAIIISVAALIGLTLRTLKKT